MQYFPIYRDPKSQNYIYNGTVLVILYRFMHDTVLLWISKLFIRISCLILVLSTVLSRPRHADVKMVLKTIRVQLLHEKMRFRICGNCSRLRACMQFPTERVSGKWRKKIAISIAGATPAWAFVCFSLGRPRKKCTIYSMGEIKISKIPPYVFF